MEARKMTSTRQKRYELGYGRKIRFFTTEFGRYQIAEMYTTCRE